MEKPTAIAVPFEVWERLVAVVKAGARLDNAPPRIVITYAEACGVLLEELRAARDCQPPGDTTT